MCLRRGFHIVERYFFSSSSSQFYLVNSVTRKLYWQRGDSRMMTNTYNMPSTDGGGQSGWGWVYCNKRINMSLVWCLVVWKSYQLFFSTKTASSHGRAGFWGWIRVETEKYLHRVSFLFFCSHFKFAVMFGSSVVLGLSREDSTAIASLAMLHQAVKGQQRRNKCDRGRASTVSALRSSTVPRARIRINAVCGAARRVHSVKRLSLYVLQVVPRKLSHCSCCKLHLKCTGGVRFLSSKLGVEI